MNFIKLPPEMQDAIWEQTVDSPRVHFLTVIAKVMDVVAGPGHWVKTDEKLCLCLNRWVHVHLRCVPFPTWIPLERGLHIFPQCDQAGENCSNEGAQRASFSSRKAVYRKIRTSGGVVKDIEQHNGTCLTINAMTDILYLNFLNFERQPVMREFEGAMMEIAADPTLFDHLMASYTRPVPERGINLREMTNVCKTGFDVFAGIRKLALELDFRGCSPALCRKRNPANNDECWVCEYMHPSSREDHIRKRYGQILSYFPDLETVYFVLANEEAVETMERLHDGDDPRKRDPQGYHIFQHTWPYSTTTYNPDKLERTTAEAASLLSCKLGQIHCVGSVFAFST